MKSRRYLGVCLAGALVAAAGCTDNFSLIILQNQVAGDQCVVSSDPTSAFQGFGVLDLTELPGQQDPGYTFTPVVQSSITAVNDQNRRIVLLGGADVELRASSTVDSQNLINALEAASAVARTHRFSGSVSPGGSTALAYPAIDRDQAAIIANMVADGQAVQVIAHTHVFGTIDGSDIVTPDFDYPITVCRGCLIEDIGDCATLSQDVVIDEGGTCYILQDKKLSCCLQPDGQMLCPAVIPPDEEDM